MNDFNKKSADMEEGKPIPPSVNNLLRGYSQLSCLGGLGFRV